MERCEILTEIEENDIKTENDIKKILNKKIFLFSTKFQNDKIKIDNTNSIICVDKRDDNVTTSYALINENNLYKYICLIGHSLLKNIDTSTLHPICNFSETYYYSYMDFHIINIFHLRDGKIIEIITDLIKTIGFPFYYTEKLYFDEKQMELINNELIKNDIIEIASFCIITYLINNLIEQKNSKYYDIAGKIFNINTEKKYVSIEKKCDLILETINKDISTINGTSIFNFKYQALIINDIYIPSYTTNNIFTFIWKKLNILIVNYFTKKNCKKYKTYICNNCGNEFLEIDERFDTKNYAYNKSKKKFCPPCSEIRIKKSKKESVKKSYKIYEEVRHLIDELTKNNISIPQKIIKEFNKIRRKDRAVKTCNSLLEQLNKIKKENNIID